MKNETITLRAHHGMCLAFFKGKGYSDGFTAHMQSVLDSLQNDPEIELVAEGDIICRKCPNLENGICRTADQVQHYDTATLSACGLQAHTLLKWKEFAKLIEENILKTGKREAICGDCEWTALCQENGQN